MTYHVRVYTVTRTISNHSPVHSSSFAGYPETRRPFGLNPVSTAVNLERADINCVMDRHVFWKVLFDGIPMYWEDLVWVNITMNQFSALRTDVGVRHWQILCIKKYLYISSDGGVDWASLLISLGHLIILSIAELFSGDSQNTLQSFNEFTAL